MLIVSFSTVGGVIKGYLGGNLLVSINKGTLRRAWLVPGSVTVSGRVNHLYTKSATHVYSA